MFMPISGRARASCLFSHFVRCGFLLCLILHWAGISAAQTMLEARQAAAEKLLLEAVRLIGKETQESIEAAIPKLLEALPAFQSANNTLLETRTLYALGYCHHSLGDKEKAVEYLRRALPGLRAVGPRRDEAQANYYLGLNYCRLGENGLALDYYNRALGLYRAYEKHEEEALTLNDIGEVYYALGENRKASGYYEQALALFRTARHGLGEAVVLNNLGVIYKDSGESQRALDCYEKSLALRRAAVDPAGEAVTLGNIGKLLNLLGRRGEALENLTQALRLFRSFGDSAGEVATLINLGEVHVSAGEKQQALDYYGRALTLSRETRNRRGESGALNNLGLLFKLSGEKQQALDYYTRALKLDRDMHDRKNEAVIINNLGDLYFSVGETQKALEHFTQALSLAREAADMDSIAHTLNNLGGVYGFLGEHRKAIYHFGEALPLFRANGNLKGEALILNNLADIYANADEAQKAVDHLVKALRLFRVIGDRSHVGTTLNNIGVLYSESAEKQKALDYYQRALEIFHSIGAPDQEAGTLNNLGNYHNSEGEKRKALEYYVRALQLTRAIHDRQSEALVLHNIAQVERDQGNPDEALAKIEASIEIIESLRGKIINQGLRSSYFATVQDYYALYIDILMRLHRQQPSAGYDLRALQASERGRARSLLEMLVETRAQIRRGVNPGLLERERALQQRLSAADRWQTQLLSGQYNKEQATAAVKEIEALAIELQQVEAQIRRDSPGYAALTQPAPLRVEAIQKELDPDTLLLEYSLGTTRSYLWVVSPTEVKSFELPGRSEVETAAKSFYELLNTPNLIYVDVARRRPAARIPADAQQQEKLETAKRLSRILLGPAATLLGRKRLLIVADGSIQYLPFAALPDPASIAQRAEKVEPLILRHEVVSLPSASTLATLRSESAARDRTPKELAVLADPVFSSDDERIKRMSAPKSSGRSAAPSNGVPGLSEKVAEVTRETLAPNGGERLDRLPGTRREAREILALVPSDKARLALDFDANRALAVSGELSLYRHVLFATHGRLDDRHPDLSSVVLSLVDEYGNPQNGYLRLNEIYNLHMPADVVTLSGCRTGLGKVVRGEGLVGLTRGFMYAGAARVVASLWRADDEATAELMVRFYRGVIKEGRTPSVALRAAQLEMMKQQRWRAPHYWAAFVLHGEWR